MNCEHFRSLFSDHLDAQLTPAEEDRLGAHLAECRACRDALLSLQLALQALAGAAPAPPQGIDARIRAAARREGLITQRWQWLLPLAASIVLFVGGYMTGRRAPAPAAPTPLFMALPTGCGRDFVPVLDRAALRMPRATPDERSLVFGPVVGVRVPASLVSHGPYRALPARALAGQGGACMPLTSAFGDALLLSASPAPEPRAVGSFVVETDPQRVLYTRVRWVKGGVAFSLEGRAEGGELLELAQEIAGRTRVGAS